LANGAKGPSSFCEAHCSSLEALTRLCTPTYPPAIHRNGSLRCSVIHRAKVRAVAVASSTFVSGFLRCQSNKALSPAPGKLHSCQPTTGFSGDIPSRVRHRPVLTLCPVQSTAVPMPYTLYHIPCTLNPKPCTPYPKPYTLYPKPYTLYPIPYTLYPIPYTLYPTPYTLYSIPYTLYPIPYTLCPTPDTLYPIPYALYPIPYTDILDPATIRYIARTPHHTCKVKLSSKPATPLPSEEGTTSKV